jgi:hypothetical protein
MILDEQTVRHRRALMLPVERGDGQAAVRQSGYRLRIDTKFHGVMLAKPGHHPKIELNPSCRFAMTGNTTNRFN